MKEDDGIFSSYTTKDWVLTILGAFVFALILHGLNYLPEAINIFFKTNQHYLALFFYAFIIMAIVSWIIYRRSLGLFEEETTETLRSKKIRIITWIGFWLCWSLYCSYLFNGQPSTNKSVLFLITFLAIGPGVAIFLLSNSMRKEEILQNEEIKAECKKNNKPYEPFTLGTEIKDYTGSYGLICIPIYFVSIILMTLMHLR